jgi:hypothetical protein
VRHYLASTLESVSCASDELHSKSREGEAEAIEDMEEWEQACPDRVGPKKEGIRKE